MRTDLLRAALAVSLLGRALPVSAQVPPRETRTRTAPLDTRTREEARQRFDRGLVLYNADDLNGALAEFRHAEKLTGHPLVLYNLARVQARLGHSADAVETLEQLQRLGSNELGQQAAERAKALYEEELSRVGTLEIRVQAPQAVVQLDNVDVARAPVPALRVTAGTHLVSIEAPGYEPRHLKVTVAGRATEVVEVALTAHEQAPAELSLASDLPDVEVTAGGELIARTPLHSRLTLKAGVYELEFRRAGYVPVRRQVLLQPGGKSEVEIEMKPSNTGLETGGVLRLEVSEPDSVVTIDGQPRLDHSLGMKLPLGLHGVRIQRAGFFDVVRDVEVKPGKNVIDATLLPTPDHLGDYVSRTRSQRTWSYIALAGGAAIAAGGGAFLIWNQGQKDDAKKAFDDYAASARAMPNGTCMDKACENTLGILVEDLDAKRQRDVFGWIGVGLGAATVTTGVLLFVLGDDPERYEPRPESDLFGALRLSVGPKAVGLSGAF